MRSREGPTPRGDDWNEASVRMGTIRSYSESRGFGLIDPDDPEDGDEEVLKMTRKSVERMSMDARTHGEHEVEKLDWTNVEEWPEHEFDVALASDVLYDEKCAQCVANVIDRVLKKKKKKITNGDDDVGDGGSITALLCDPANRENREKFSEMCDKLGLEAIDADFPGNPKMRLVQVLRK